MTWGKQAAEALEALAQKQLADLEKGVVPDSWQVLGRILGGFAYLDILDIGCGVGSTFKFIQHLVSGDVKYFGIDSNAAAIDYAKTRGANNHSDGNIYRLNPHMSEVYNVVLSNGTLNHLQYWTRALSEMARLSYFFVILHRLWVHHDDTPTETWYQEVYGEQVFHSRINEKEMVDLLDGLDFELLEKTSSDGSGKLDAGWTYVFGRKD